MDSTVQTRPSRHIAPTSKLTDVNNAAQPELTFQRQAVLAFRTRAQEAPSALEPFTNPPTIRSPLRNVSSIVDTGIERTDSIESGGYADIDSPTSGMVMSR